MENTNGKLNQRIISGVFQNKKFAAALEVISLLLLGALALVLRSYLRAPLNLPGRHGVEFMAIIILGRQFSKFRFASSISAMAVLTMIFVPFLGIKNPLMASAYAAPCIVLDYIYNKFKLKNNKVFFLALFAGLSYMAIPLLRLVFCLFTGSLESAFIKHGFVVPIISHFFYGFAGGLFGAGFFQLFKLKRKSLE
ncbi:hypothetical protein ACFLRW_04300 [Acidobacteriota bacterium]